MVTMLLFTSIVLVAGALLAMLAIYRRGRGGVAPAQPETGTLYVTGVSPRPAAQGEQYVTITGTLSGPSVQHETVYGRFAWDVGQWPSPGDNLPVVYPAGKPQHWRLSHPGARPPLGS
jgi:hypothetical protein